MAVGWSIDLYNKMVMGSIPDQGIYQVADSNSSQGVYGRQLVDVSHFLPLLSSLSEISKNISSGED